MARLADPRPIIADLASRNFQVDRSKIRSDSRLIDFGVDSVRAMDLVVELEFQFSVSISDRDMADLRTFEDIARFIERA